MKARGTAHMCWLTRVCVAPGSRARAGPARRSEEDQLSRRIQNAHPRRRGTSAQPATVRGSLLVETSWTDTGQPGTYDTTRPGGCCRCHRPIEEARSFEQRDNVCHRRRSAPAASQPCRRPQARLAAGADVDGGPFTTTMPPLCVWRQLAATPASCAHYWTPGQIQTRTWPCSALHCAAQASSACWSLPGRHNAAARGEQ